MNIIKQHSRLLVSHLKGEGLDVVIANVNARGLKQNMKRLAMFRYFKQQHYDIIYDVIYLQEQHLTKQDIPIWEKQWGGKIIYVEGNAQVSDREK